MEIYKQIYDTRYEVSNYGNVKSKITNIILTPHKGGTSPYLMVNLHLGGSKTKGYLLHRLVAIHHIENPQNKEQVNHKDGNKCNNNVDNLEWATPKENMLHAFESGLYKKYNNQTYKGKSGELHNRSIKLLCSNGDVYYGLSEASRKLGLHISTIGYAVKENRPLRSGLSFTKI